MKFKYNEINDNDNERCKSIHDSEKLEWKDGTSVFQDTKQKNNSNTENDKRLTFNVDRRLTFKIDRRLTFNVYNQPNIDLIDSYPRADMKKNNSSVSTENKFQKADEEAIPFNMGLNLIKGSRFDYEIPENNLIIKENNSRATFIVPPKIIIEEINDEQDESIKEKQKFTDAAKKGKINNIDFQKVKNKNIKVTMNENKSENAKNFKVKMLTVPSSRISQR